MWVWAREIVVVTHARFATDDRERKQPCLAVCSSSLSVF